MSGSGVLIALLVAGLLFWPLALIAFTLGPWGVLATICLFELAMLRLLREPGRGI